jgi:adenylate cyclase
MPDVSVPSSETRRAGAGACKATSSPLGRLGDPLSWSGAEKCLFVATVFLTFTLWYGALELVLTRHREFAPYYDRVFLPTALTVQSATIMAWLLVLVVAWVSRQRGVQPRRLVPVTILIALWELLYGSYFFGLYTNLFGGLTIVASFAVGWVIFDRRTITLAAVCAMLGFICLTVAEQAGLLPYAPFFAEAPFGAGRLERSFLLTMGGVTFLMMLLVLAIIYFIVDRWHDREHKLAITSQQLARANEVIGRYVASQLAEQIHAGNYYNLERHERRKLTLFFSDIQNFAAIADLVEPEDLSTLLNEYLSEMTAIGERYGATIDKFVGDAIMIFFGAPLATSDRDHALRAVRMAIEMQSRLGELRSRWERNGSQHPFHIRIGINTGHASIGNFGSKTRMDYTAIGRQVNLAARLQTQCEPDRVLLAHSTWVLVRDEVPCGPKGEIAVKGFREPVTVYEVDGTPPTGAATAGEPV